MSFFEWGCHQLFFLSGFFSNCIRLLIVTTTNMANVLPPTSASQPSADVIPHAFSACIVEFYSLCTEVSTLMLRMVALTHTYDWVLLSSPNIIVAPDPQAFDFLDPLACYPNLKACEIPDPQPALLIH